MASDTLEEEMTYPITVKDEFGFSWPEGLVVDDIIYLDTKEDQSLKYIEEGNSFENHPILKSIDFEKIDREDNPILIKFHFE